MLNRALVVAIIIISLGMIGIIGYVVGNPNRPQSIPEGMPLNTDGKQPPPKAFQVFERDIVDLVSGGTYRSIQDYRESRTLRFQAVAGNKIEGEVTIKKYTAPGITVNVDKGVALVWVRDPYDNVVLESAMEVISEPSTTYLKSAQDYPWKFTFVASVTGEYVIDALLEPTIRQTSIESPRFAAHLKATIYNE